MLSCPKVEDTWNDYAFRKRKAQPGLVCYRKASFDPKKAA
jgi:hypothetical protein